MYLCNPKLSDGVTAALQILVLPVQVRILIGQQGNGFLMLRGDNSPLDF